MRRLLAWWLRVYRAFQLAQKARAEREVLARLDARALRDIGLQSWNAELADRAETERQRRLLRLAASRIGVC